MSLDLEYPSLSEMLDRYFRGPGEGDEAAVAAFLAAEGDEGRERVLDELQALLAAVQQEPDADHDPFELRQYLMIHRFDMLPDEGPEAWLRRLGELLERGYVV